MKRTLLLIFMCLFSGQACAQAPQGSVSGYVKLRSGNCMPSIGGEKNSCGITPVSRKVFAYPEIKSGELRMNFETGQMYLKKDYTPIAETTSDANGYYKIELPEGNYSILTEEKNAPYCNWYSNIAACPVQVKSEQDATFNLTINNAVD